MRHLQTRPPEAALDVEALVGLAAVEDALVAAHLLSDVVEGLDEAQTEFLALLVAGDGDVFDVTNGTEGVDAVVPGVLVNLSLTIQGRLGDVQLALDDQCACCDNGCVLPRGVLDHNNVVSALLEHGVELVAEALGCHITNGGEDAEAVEEAGAEVIAAESAQNVARGQSGLHLRGEEVGGEQGGHSWFD